MRSSGSGQKSFVKENSKRLVDAEDAWLFETPADLICPITHELFKDPVINAVGQVYERAAIEQHLQHRGTDPVTNAALDSTALIPVYTLKSRAFEFREHVAKTCVEKACSTRSCEVAVRYLVRAAELVNGVRSSLKIPGLSDEVLDFLHTHPSNAYDAMALRMFADGLRGAGYVDQATQLYLRLVEYGQDRGEQAAALKQVLRCLSQDSQAQQQQPQQQPQQQQQPDKGVLPFLAHFLETQQTFGAAEVIELLHEASVPDAIVLQLCEQLLVRHSHNSSSMGSTYHGSSNGHTGTAHPQGGLRFNDLLLHYSRLRLNTLQQQVDKLQAQVAYAKAAGSPRKDAKGRQGGQHHQQQVPNGRSVDGLQANADTVLDVGKPGMRQRGKTVGQVVRFVGRRRRAVASTLFMVISLLDTRQLAVRAAQAGSAVLMAYCHHSRSGDGIATGLRKTMVEEV